MIVIYDIEVYPNVFTLTAFDADSDRQWVFEISDRVHDGERLCEWINECDEMVGFNNESYDYPVIHVLLQAHGRLSADAIYSKSVSIINTPFNQRFSNMIWDRDKFVPQIDLFKIYHFDNMARSTSLKMIEFNMRMSRIEDLPYPVGTPLTPDQIDELLEYNAHDVKATKLLYNESTDKIAFRRTLTEQYGENFMNYSDTKIGSAIFVHKLKAAGVECDRSVQTKRASMRLSDAILPWIEFERPEFQRVLDWMRSQTITETKGVFDDVHAVVNGLRYDFGTGGLHASVTDSNHVATGDRVIEVRDVASYYPSLAISNRWFPAHLSDTFCDIYQAMFEERRTHAKGTDENAMLKLALNGTYGNSNNKYSPFYDPMFTMKITLNGQLLLSLLCEKLIKAPSLRVIFANTDGVAYECDRSDLPYVNAVCDWWQKLTGLVLETDHVSRMWIRDVNNYVQEYTGGKIKRKGAYEYNLEHHQNQSALVVKKAVEAYFLHGTDPVLFIASHSDPFDFMLRTKVPRGSMLYWGGSEVQRISRYYISNAPDAMPLVKVMPAKGEQGEYKRANGITDVQYDTVMSEIGKGVWDERIHTRNKSVYESRSIGINNGWNVTVCNDMSETLTDICFEWYVGEAIKLLTGRSTVL